MPLSAYTDGNRFLDEDKLRFSDAESYEADVTSADRLVRASLIQIFDDATVNAWDIASNNVPEIVIDISAMVAAAYLYQRIYSEETTEVPAYANALLDRAAMLLVKLRTGELSLGDTVAGTQWSQDDFWPNDTTIDIHGDPIRLFSMEQQF